MLCLLYIKIKNKKIQVNILFFFILLHKNIVAVSRRGVNLAEIIGRPGTAFNINSFSK